MVAVESGIGNLFAAYRSAKAMLGEELPVSGAGKLGAAIRMDEPSNTQFAQTADFHEPHEVFDPGSDLARNFD